MIGKVCFHVTSSEFGPFYSNIYIYIYIYGFYVASKTLVQNIDFGLIANPLIKVKRPL